MDLVTVSEHDSNGAAEELRRYADFFVSEEVTCRMPSGNELHIGVYDLTERQHVEIQRRRNDLPRLLAYLNEENLFYSVNHAFSALTGRRSAEDFTWFEGAFPAVEIRNGHVPERSNRLAERLAEENGRAGLGGSDAHTLGSLGSVSTRVPGARSKDEFLAGLRRRRGQVEGRSGHFWRLTRDVLQIGAALMEERPLARVLAPLVLAVPVVTLFNYVVEDLFARRWERYHTLDRDTSAGTMRPASGEASS
jgi:predicted metal-dependent phosphoesterase TrpH